MPTKEEWTKVFTDLAVKLNLPCKLRFNPDVRIGRHVTLVGELHPHHYYDEGCAIEINPDVKFHVPAHLILHEGAHCRANAFDEYHGHDEMWAKVLCKMYVEAGIALPYSTGFEQFAKAAGIKHKVYDEVGKGTIVIENKHLV